MRSSVAALFASAALVAGHGIIDEVVINGVWYPGTKNYDTPDNDKSPVRGIPNNLGFVEYYNLDKPQIACSSAGLKGRPLTPEVPAGGQVGVRWGGDGGPDKKQWPHPEGPIISYLASCNGKCADFDASNAQFFKIKEEGLDTSKRPNAAGNDHTPAGDGLWAQNRIQYENSYDWVTIPADIKAGEYLLRHEPISLHGAHTYSEGAQFYPGCVQIKVTGGGNATPATTPATQLYKPEDGIIDIWTPSPSGIKSYKIPGPALYVPGQASNPAPATSAAPSTSKPAAAAAVTSVVVTTSPAAAAGGNQATSPASEPAAAPTGSKSCKAKRAAKRSIADESRAIYDRALAGAQARHAHAHKRSTL